MPEAKIHCVIVRMSLPEDQTDMHDPDRDLLPWADPYICQLREQLQREVRAERRAAHVPRQRDQQPWNAEDKPRRKRYRPHQPR